MGDQPLGGLLHEILSVRIGWPSFRHQPGQGRQLQLAWALQDRPELLADVGVPSVLRLIEVLPTTHAGGLSHQCHLAYLSIMTLTCGFTDLTASAACGSGQRIVAGQKTLVTL